MEPEILKLWVDAGRREGYVVEERGGLPYFPDKVWHLDLGKIIERERLCIGWEGGHCLVSTKFFDAQGETLEEAVLRYLAYR